MAESNKLRIFDTSSTSGASSYTHLIDSDKDEPEDKSLTKIYTGVEAATIFHLCQTSLQDISGLVSKYPKTDDPVDKIEIEYDRNKKAKLEKQFKELGEEINSFTTEETDYIAGEGGKISDFIKKHKHRPDILFYKDYTTRKVYVVGRDYVTANSGLHEVKVLLGKLKPTKRTQRQISDPGKEQRSSSLKGSSYAPNSDKNKPYDDNAPVSSYGARSHNAPRSHQHSSGYDDGEEFSFEADLKNGFKLKIYKASITRLEVDTIVNAANDCLMHGGGVARVIAVAAGHKLDQESRDYISRFGYLKVGENCLTTAGNMTQYKSVIHAVGPQWHDYKNKVECMDALYETVWNVLDTCDTKGYFSVGMSSISAGIYGVPKELCADMYVKAAVDFSDKNTPFPKELHIIDVDTSILKLVQESAIKWQERMPIDQKVTVPKFLAKHPELDVGGWNTSNKGGRKDFKGQDHSRSRDNNHGNSRDSYGNDHKGHGRYGQNRSNSPDKNKYGNHGNSDRGGHHNSDQGHGRHNKGDQESADKHHKTASSEFKKDGKLPCVVTAGNQRRTAWHTDEYNFYFDSMLTVKVYNGSIEKVSGVDVIVCGNDTKLSSPGYIAKALFRRGGKKYEKAVAEMQKKHDKNAKVNDVFKCKAGDLNVQLVFHVVLKRFLFGGETATGMFEEAITNVLKKANKNQIRRLAIPLIGTGDIQSDDKKLDVACRTFINAICKFCSNADVNRLDELHLVNNSAMVCKALLKVLIETAEKTSDNKPAHSGRSDYSHSSNTRTYTGSENRDQEAGTEGFSTSYRSDNRRKDSRQNVLSSHHGNRKRSSSPKSMEVDDDGGDDSRPIFSQKPDEPKPQTGNLNIVYD